MAERTPAGVGIHGGIARQYDRGTGVLGAVRGPTGQVRFCQRGCTGGGGARSPSAPGAAMVWNLEKRKHALRSDVGEGGYGEISARDSTGWNADRCAFASRAEHAGSRQGRVHSIDAAPEPDRW